MNKRFFVLIILAMAIMACNLSVRDVFGNSGGNSDEYYDEVEYTLNLTATLFFVQTLIVEATTTAQFETAQANEKNKNELLATSTSTPEPNKNQFCSIYAEFVNELGARVGHYEEVLGDGGDAHPIAVEADQSIEAFMDRLTPHAPDEIQSQVDSLANMSLSGLFSSNEGVPKAEPLLEVVDRFAEENCNISLNN